MSASPRKNVASKGVERIDHYIDSLDPGIRLHVREKRPEGKKKFEDQATLLIVHGRMAPGPVAYDLPVPGYSWMDYIASRGFDVFALSIRGFGESTWPQEMHVNPKGKPPAIPRQGGRAGHQGGGGLHLRAAGREQAQHPGPFLGDDDGAGLRGR